MGLRDCNFQSSYGPRDARLHEFYIPALSESKRYDRLSGYFSSVSLAVAAQGVAHLVQNDGTMRLLVGADLDPKDVEAIHRGHSLETAVRDRLLATLTERDDQVVERRLEILAWMVAEDLLQIRVVLPLSPEGRVLSARESQDYFHAKEGLFTDEHGDQVGFSGSINESSQGWGRNYEQFNVFFSWGEGQTYLREASLRFRRLWTGTEPDWKCLPIPQAVKEELLAYRPTQVPARDPLAEEEPETRPADDREALLFQFLKDAPRFPDVDWLGVKTSAVDPWPHQEQVVTEAVERYPERFLLCDEVGLGKTIEAGLILRELLLTQTVERVLLLVPKSLGRQWQEELYEKFQLQVPLYKGSQGYEDVFRNEPPVSANNPWEAFPVMIASSHLAKRQERQEELLKAKPWDLVLVDEAHHARRRDFREDRYRPNRLLELLTQLKERTEGLLLLTATPMQISPVEVWDLLRVIGVGGRWGASKEHFLHYYRQLRFPPDEIDWDFMLNMLKDHLESGGELDSDFAREAKDRLGPVEWREIEELPFKRSRQAALKQLSPEGQRYLRRLLREHTPLTRFSFRNTRQLLHRYREEGLLAENVPRRKPEPEWIPMTPAEQALYERIDEYITDFYKKYEEKRRGLGFVMTVYRRRLTSSFYAMEQSLLRRKQFLEGQIKDDWLTEEDTEVEDLEFDIHELLQDEKEDGELALFSEEIAYIEDFLDKLSELEGESKIEVLLSDLNRFFRERDKVIIFTQYTDTMDFIRNKLRAIYGRQVACYSGRGGERWTGSTWEEANKEDIKTAFLGGEELKILVCTEAASEGLNLQTCGVLINYDMPWNPMRVEQRIGRIDRIGQLHDQVWIKHYFYEETVEADIYKRLGHRISWFEDVVGRLQPILGRVRDLTQRMAMSPKTERAERMATELDDIDRTLETQTAEHLDIDDHMGQPPLTRSAKRAPVSLDHIETLCTTSEHTGHRFRPHPEEEGAYLLTLAGKTWAVTFNPELFDKKPYSLRLLTYKEPLFHQLLQRVPAPDEPLPGGLLRVEGEGGCGYYVRNERHLQCVHRFEILQAILEETQEPPSAWPEAAIEAAQNDLEGRIQKKKHVQKRIKEKRRQSRRASLQARGRLLLSRAAFIRGLLAHEEEEQDRDFYQRQGFLLLKQEQYPFTGVMRTCGIRSAQDLEPVAEDLFEATPRSLRSQYQGCKAQAEELLREVAAFRGNQ